MRAFLMALWFAPGLVLVADGYVEQVPWVLHVGIGWALSSAWTRLISFAAVMGER